MAVTFVLEESTPYGLVYKCTSPNLTLGAGGGTVGLSSTGVLPNDDIPTASPNIGIDKIPQSPFAAMLTGSPTDPGLAAAPDIAALIASANPKAGNLPPFQELDVRMTDEIEFQLLGATDYPRWSVNHVPDVTSGRVAFFVRAPSAGGTAMLRIRRIHSRGL